MSRLFFAVLAGLGCAYLAGLCLAACGGLGCLVWLAELGWAELILLAWLVWLARLAGLVWLARIAALGWAGLC